MRYENFWFLLLCHGLIFTVCWEWRSLYLSFSFLLNRHPSFFFWFSFTVRCWCCCCFFYLVHTINRIKAGIVDGCTENVVAICITVAVADSVIVVGAKQLFFFLNCARANGLFSWHSVQISECVLVCANFGLWLCRWCTVTVVCVDTFVIIMAFLCFSRAD